MVKKKLYIWMDWAPDHIQIKLHIRISFKNWKVTTYISTTYYLKETNTCCCNFNFKDVLSVVRFIYLFPTRYTTVYVWHNSFAQSIWQLWKQVMNHINVFCEIKMNWHWQIEFLFSTLLAVTYNKKLFLLIISQSLNECCPG